MNGNENLDIEERPFISSKEINHIIPALIEAQANYPKIVFDVHVEYPTTKGPKKYSYASLSNILESIRPILTQNKVLIMQTMRPEGEKTKIITSLIHSSGQYVASEVLIALPYGDPQAAGTIITYFKRYTLAAIAGIQADDDDDGKQGSDSGKPPSAQSKKEPDKKKELPGMSSEAFQKALPTYREKMKLGTNSADGIIRFLQTKYTLTQEQILEIRRDEIEKEEKDHANS